jgi:hypothetical protein
MFFHDAFRHVQPDAGPFSLLLHGEERRQMHSIEDDGHGEIDQPVIAVVLRIVSLDVGQKLLCIGIAFQVSRS